MLFVQPIRIDEERRGHAEIREDRRRGGEGIQVPVVERHGDGTFGYAARCGRTHEVLQADRREVVAQVRHVFAKHSRGRAQRVGIRGEIGHAMVGKDGRGEPPAEALRGPAEAGRYVLFSGPAEAGNDVRFRRLEGLHGTNGNHEGKVGIRVIEISRSHFFRGHAVQKRRAGHHVAVRRNVEGIKGKRLREQLPG